MKRVQDKNVDCWGEVKRGRKREGLKEGEKETRRKREKRRKGERERKGEKEKEAEKEKEGEKEIYIKREKE